MTIKRKLHARPMLIGLMGLRGIGKTTTAQAVCNRYDGFRRMSFADALRSEANEYFANERLKDPVISRWLHSIGDAPFSHENKDTLIPGLGVTPRDILIEIGEARRQIDPLHWVNKVQERVLACPYHVIIDDVRFEAEVDFVQRVNGHVMLLTSSLDASDAKADCTPEHLVDRRDVAVVIAKGSPEETAGRLVETALRLNLMRTI